MLRIDTTCHFIISIKARIPLCMWTHQKISPFGREDNVLLKPSAEHVTEQH